VVSHVPGPAEFSLTDWPSWFDNTLGLAGQIADSGGVTALAAAGADVGARRPRYMVFL